MLQIIEFLVYTLTSVYVVVIILLMLGWLRIPLFKRKGFQQYTRVSILIAARNEEDKIGITITDILNQDYPAEFTELIVVDDHSTDRTSDIIRSYASSGVKLIQLNEKEPLNSYKKKAISEAIAISNGELIITTDADCRMNKSWLSAIVSYYQIHQSKLISSPVAYFKEKSFFERLQTLEFSYLIGLGASSIGNKMPSTCNGANLAYRKDVFLELKGFQGIDNLASGDDELFLHKVAEKYPDSIGFCKSADAIVYTDAKPDLKEFIRQRRRWASKSTKYKDKKIVTLGVLIWLFNLSLVLGLLGGFFDSGYFILAAGALLAKLVVETAFLYPVMGFFGRRELLLFLPLLTVIHAVYIVYIGIAGNSGKYVWKGRLVK